MLGDVCGRDAAVDSLPPSVASGCVTGGVLSPFVTVRDDEVVMIRVGCGVVSVAVSDTLDE